MKTISEHPLMIGRLLEADAARRARRAQWRRFWASPWTTLAFLLLLLSLIFGGMLR